MQNGKVCCKFDARCPQLGLVGGGRNQLQHQQHQQHRRHQPKQSARLVRATDYGNNRQPPPPARTVAETLATAAVATRRSSTTAYPTAPIRLPTAARNKEHKERNLHAPNWRRLSRGARMATRSSSSSSVHHNGGNKNSDNNPSLVPLVTKQVSIGSSRGSSSSSSPRDAADASAAGDQEAGNSP